MYRSTAGTKMASAECLVLGTNSQVTDVVNEWKFSSKNRGNHILRQVYFLFSHPSAYFLWETPKHPERRRATSRKCRGCFYATYIDIIN